MMEVGVNSPQVFVLCRSKRYKVCWSAFIARKLTEAGMYAYRVTPGYVPKFRPENCKLLINYGCSTVPIWWDRLPDDCVILNHPDQVRTSVDKIAMQQAFEELCPGKHLEYGLNRVDAQAYLDRGETIVARTLISSHSGRGIVLTPPNPLPDARLYTVLKRRRGLREYRVFLNEGKLMDVVQKKRKTQAKLTEEHGAEAARTWWDSRERQVIRCWSNGWAFCHNDLDVTDQDVFEDIANTAARILTWGCVDVLIDTRTKEYYMVEVNSAPGLDAGNTQHVFVNAFLAIGNRIGIHNEVRTNLEE